MSDKPMLKPYTQKYLESGRSLSVSLLFMNAYSIHESHPENNELEILAQSLSKVSSTRRKEIRDHIQKDLDQKLIDGNSEASTLIGMLEYYDVNVSKKADDMTSYYSVRELERGRASTVVCHYINFFIYSNSHPDSKVLGLLAKNLSKVNTQKRIELRQILKEELSDTVKKEDYLTAAILRDALKYYDKHVS